MKSEEVDQPMRRGQVGANRVLRAAAIASEMVPPARGYGAGGVISQGISHRPMQRVSMRPRNMRSSEPWSVSKPFAPRRPSASTPLGIRSEERLVGDEFVHTCKTQLSQLH